MNVMKLIKTPIPQLSLWNGTQGSTSSPPQTRLPLTQHIPEASPDSAGDGPSGGGTSGPPLQSQRCEAECGQQGGLVLGGRQLPEICSLCSRRDRDVAAGGPLGCSVGRGSRCASGLGWTTWKRGCEAWNMIVDS